MVSPEIEFAHMLRETAASGNAELAELECSSSVVKYASLFKGLFPIHPLLVESSPRPLKIIDCSFERAGMFGYILVLAQTQNLEGVGGDEAARLMAKTLKRGGDQIVRVLDDYSNRYDTDVFDCEQYTPDCLLRLASNVLLNYPSVLGMTQENSQEDVLSAHDDLLGDACAQIIDNKKFILPKNASPAEEIFLRSMNSVRVMYHAAEHSHFANSLSFAAGATAIGGDLKNLENVWLKNTDGEILRSGFRRYLLDVGACEASYAAIEYFDPAMFVRTLYNQCGKNAKLLGQKMAAGTAVVKQTHLARRLVDAVATGDVLVGDTTVAYMCSQQPALKLREKVELEETLKWQRYDKSKRPKLRQNRPAEGSDEWHRDCSIEETLDRLEAIIDLWGEGDIMRSCIPDRAEDEQYFIAVLPETRADGTVLEHGIADFPNDRDALYFWRAEKGVNRYGEVELTWREIFSQKKSNMREYGAKKMLHTSTLDERLEEFLTRDPRRLSEKKYQLGSSAVAGLVIPPEEIASS